MYPNEPPPTPGIALAAGALAGALAGAIALRIPSVPGGAVFLLAVGAGGTCVARPFRPRGGAAWIPCLRIAGAVALGGVVVSSAFANAPFLLPLLAAALLLLAPLGAAAFRSDASPATGFLAVAGLAAGLPLAAASVAAAWPGLVVLSGVGVFLLVASAMAERLRVTRRLADADDEPAGRAAGFLAGLTAGAVPFAAARAIAPDAPFTPAFSGLVAAAYFLPFGLGGALVARVLPRAAAALLALGAGSVVLLFAPIEHASDPGRLEAIFDRFRAGPGATGDVLAPFLAALLLLAPTAAILGGASGALLARRRRAAWPLLAAIPLGAFCGGHGLSIAGVPPGIALAAAALPAALGAIAAALPRKERGVLPVAAAAAAAAAASVAAVALAPRGLAPGVLRTGESVEALASSGAHAGVLLRRADGAARILVDGDEVQRTDAPDAILETSVAEIALFLSGRTPRAVVSPVGGGAAAAALASRGAESVFAVRFLPGADDLLPPGLPPGIVLVDEIPAGATHVVAPPWRGRGALAMAGLRSLLDPVAPAVVVPAARDGADRTIALPLECLDESLHPDAERRLAAAGYRSMWIAHPQAFRPMAIFSTRATESLARLRENLASLRPPPHGIAATLFSDPLDALSLHVKELTPPAALGDVPPVEIAQSRWARRSERDRALDAHRFLARRREDPSRAPFSRDATPDERARLRARFEATSKLFAAHEIRLASVGLGESALEERIDEIIAIETEALALAPDFSLPNEILADYVEGFLRGAEYERARDLAAKLREASPRFWRHAFLEGLVTYRLLDPEGSVESFRAAAALGPDEAIAHAYLGVALYRSGGKEDAIAALERALALDPAQPLVPKPLGDLYAERGDLARAIPALERAIEIAPGDEDARRLLESVRARARAEKDGGR